MNKKIVLQSALTYQRKNLKKYKFPVFSILVEKSIQKEINKLLKKLNFGKGDLISETFSPWLFHQKNVPNHYS